MYKKNETRNNFKRHMLNGNFARMKKNFSRIRELKHGDTSPQNMKYF